MQAMQIFEIEADDLGECAFCSGWQPARYRVPGLRGVWCSLGCIESELFGMEHCRSCGTDMLKTYTSLESRLRSDDCRKSYKAHVLDDETAALGTGKRFMLWLQKNQPATFERMLGDKKDAAIPSKRKGGRPIKHKTDNARRAANADYQRRFREKDSGSLEAVLT